MHGSRAEFDNFGSFATRRALLFKLLSTGVGYERRARSSVCTIIGVEIFSSVKDATEGREAGDEDRTSGRS